MTRYLMVAVCVVFTSAAWAQEQAPGGRRAGARARQRVQIGIQLYTFNKFPFIETIDKSREAGVRVVEGFAWHKIGGDAGDAQLNPDAPAAAIEQAQQKLQEARIRLVSYYVSDFGKDAAAARKYFDFAKKMGIQIFVAEPPAEQLEMLNKLAKEHDIKIAYHNHPRNPKDESYKNWDPEQVIKMIKPFEQIGVCADTGHMLRSGIDPVEGLKKYEGRIISLHLKDTHEKGEKAHDVPLGTGIGNVKGQLEELKRQNFTGLVAIEYEHNMDDNLADVKQSVEYLRRALRELGMGGGGGGAGRGQGAGGRRARQGPGTSVD